MDKLNCWEFKKCGCEEGGERTETFGVCPASTAVKLDGTNSGKNGGRACWAIADTLCGGRPQGGFAVKLPVCMRCEFFQQVGVQEGPDHEGAKDIFRKLQAT